MKMWSFIIFKKKLFSAFIHNQGCLLILQQKSSFLLILFSASCVCGIGPTDGAGWTCCRRPRSQAGCKAIFPPKVNFITGGRYQTSQEVCHGAEHQKCLGAPDYSAPAAGELNTHTDLILGCNICRLDVVAFGYIDIGKCFHSWDSCNIQYHFLVHCN